MINFKKGALKCAAVVTKKTAELAANKFCIYWQYDPKMPKSVKKLRKF